MHYQKLATVFLELVKLLPEPCIFLHKRCHTSIWIWRALGYLSGSRQVCCCIPLFRRWLDELSGVFAAREEELVLTEIIDERLGALLISQDADELVSRDQLVRLFLDSRDDHCYRGPAGEWTANCE